MKAAALVALFFPRALAQIEWKSCPEGQSGNDCASLTLPLDPDDATNNATVISFVRRFYAGDAATSKGLWMFAGGPGDTAESFAGGATYFIGTDPSVTVYLVDQRGVGLSSPVNCENPPLYNFDPNNASTIKFYSDCNAEIAENYGTTLKYYGSYFAAHDFKAVVDIIEPTQV